MHGTRMLLLGWLAEWNLFFLVAKSWRVALQCQICFPSKPLVTRRLVFSRAVRWATRLESNMDEILPCAPFRHDTALRRLYG